MLEISKSTSPVRYLGSTTKWMSAVSYISVEDYSPEQTLPIQPLGLGRAGCFQITILLNLIALL